MWSETYDRELTDIFAIQDEIARKVVDVLQVTLLGTAPISRETDTEAYSLYLAAFGYWFDRNFKKAEELFRRNGELHRNPELDFDLARALLLQGRYDEALSMIEVHQEFGDHQNLIRAFVYHSVGRHKEAAESLRSIIDHQGIPLGFQIAEMYAWQGKPDEAFEWLEISFNNRDGGMTYLIIDPFLDSLHDDPRWRPLVERMNLLEYWDALPAR